MDLGGRFEYFLCSPRKLGKIPILIRIFPIEKWYQRCLFHFVSTLLHYLPPRCWQRGLQVKSSRMGLWYDHRGVLSSKRWIRSKNVSCVAFFWGDSIGVGWSSHIFLLLEFVPWHHLDLRNCNFPMVPFFKLCQLWNNMHVTFVFFHFFWLCQESAKTRDICDRDTVGMWTPPRSL